MLVAQNKIIAEAARTKHILAYCKTSRSIKVTFLQYEIYEPCVLWIGNAYDLLPTLVDEAS